MCALVLGQKVVIQTLPCKLFLFTAKQDTERKQYKFSGVNEFLDSVTTGRTRLDALNSHKY